MAAYYLAMQWTRASAPKAPTYPVLSEDYNFNTCGPFYWHGSALILAWISNYIHYKVWDEITYPFLNFNGATVGV